MKKLLLVIFFLSLINTCCFPQIAAEKCKFLGNVIAGYSPPDFLDYWNQVTPENAGKWGVDINKVGIVGFSAGGHLASTAATHFQKATIENKSNTNLRPDFQVVVYPVISMQDSLTHRDSRNNLLGKTPSRELTDQYSNELQVTANTPPTYITHAADDNVVDVDNSILYFEALRHNKVPVEMHIYPSGGHGFIFRQPDWIDPLLLWMKKNKWNQQ